MIYNGHALHLITHMAHRDTRPDQESIPARRANMAPRQELRQLLSCRKVQRHLKRVQYPV
jgi:hypothetical protein